MFYFIVIDIVKIKVGQKANISFDAIDDLSLVGTVSQINISGSVSSGVVSYAVKIAFDDPSNQVRPGMSATANIIVGIATDVLSVPNAAVKSGTSISYVDVFNSTSSLVENGSGAYISSILPTRKTVTLGLVGDTYTEITSGLDEGEIVVSKTNSASTVSKTSGTNSSSQKNNMGSGMGGMRF